MRDPKNVLADMADVINLEGLHRGEQLGQRGYVDRFDLCAHAYLRAEWVGSNSVPAEFFDDELGGIRLIESSAGAMAALRAISDVLDSTVDEEELVPGLHVPNYIAHVSNWARFGPPCSNQPPTVSEVIGCLHRAANTLAIQTPAAPAA
jgi:hypothetical protein